MAARTRLLQLAIAAVDIAIAALVFTSIWPFPSGDFSIDLPSASEVEWEYLDGVVNVHAPFSVDNGWIYDVNDLTIYYSVTNYSGDELAEQTISIGDIPAHQITSSAVDFSFDLLAMYDRGADAMIFNDDLLSFYLEVSCMYTADLVKFFASYQVSVPWEALINGYGVLDVTYPTTLPSPGEPVEVTVDYWLDTASRLAVMPPALVNISYYGDGNLMGWTETTILLGGNRTGTIVVSVTPAIYSSYYVELTIRVLDFTVTERVEAVLP
jgi:hypothetical protein